MTAAPGEAAASARNAPLLEVSALCVAYGKVEALHEASLRVDAGTIVTVIGPNGAGKTTLLAAVIGLLARTRGEVRFGGRGAPHGQAEPAGGQAVEYTVEEMVERGMGLVPESRALFGGLSVADNLLLGAFARHRAGARDHAAAMQRVFGLFPRLEQRRAQDAAKLSGGERQMLALGRALMGQPCLLLLDEPSLGLAPRIVREIFRIIAELRSQGVSILLVEQNARAALQVADYAYVLENGRVTLEGAAAELAHNPRVIESYLGLGRER